MVNVGEAGQTENWGQPGENTRSWLRRHWAKKASMWRIVQMVLVLHALMLRRWYPDRIYNVGTTVPIFF